MCSFCSFLFQVTVFQAVRNPGRPDKFIFTVDGSLRNIIVYITGSPTLSFSVTSPTGAVIVRFFWSASPLAFKSIFIFKRFCLLLSTSGIFQSSSQRSGPLASLMTAGNLRRLSLNSDSQTGSWQISVISYHWYSIKVTGQWRCVNNGSVLKEFISQIFVYCYVCSGKL